MGIEAAEGTVFHDHAELCLTTGFEPHHFPTGLKQTVSGHVVSYTEEMMKHLYAGLDKIAEMLDDEAILFVEQRVRIEPWTLEPGGFGTSDVCIIYPNRRKIVVFDWKYGKVAVSPIKNDQLILYALGCWETFGRQYFDGPENIEVELHIWQPRIPDAGGMWPTTMEWLLKEGEQIVFDAAMTYDPNAPRTAGEKQCMYCKARASCAENAAYRLEMVQLRFTDIDEGIEWGLEPTLPEVSEWTPERRSYVWLHRKSFIKWLGALHDAMILDAKEEKPTPYVKVVAGNAGKRTYRASDQAKAKAYLIEALGRDKAVKEELITPAAAETALGKKRYEEELKQFVFQAEPKPMLVPETHPRPALPSIGIKFDGIPEDDNDEDE